MSWNKNHEWTTHDLQGNSGQFGVGVGWWRKWNLGTLLDPSWGAQLVLRHLWGSDPGPILQRIAGIGAPLWSP